MSTHHSLAAVLALGLFVAVAEAAPVAYWRHEEGAAGAAVAAGADSVLDSTGNGNHMQTFAAFTSATYSASVSPVPLRSGLSNTRSLDFGPGGDDAQLNDDNFTSAKPINQVPFSALTVEVAFRSDNFGPYQTIIGKDGKPLGDAPGESDHAAPPFRIQVTGSLDFSPNQLFVQWVDGDATAAGDVHVLTSGDLIMVGTWKHVAVTINATDAALYVAGETGPYVLLDSITGDFAGPSGNVIAADPGDWTIGRGYYNGSIADWTDGLIDEARISNTVLAPSAFLFAPVPEPGSLALAAASFLACLRRGCRRCK